MSNIKLSVVMPAYNESKNLKRGVLDEVNNFLKDQSYSYEVLIVDDGSTDDTLSLVKAQIKSKTGFKLIKNPHGGKAITVMTGLLASTGEIALFTDTDQSTPINEIAKLLEKFNQGYDLVIGSRSGRKGAPLIRKIYAVGFALLRNLILGLPFSDTQCGFKAFNRTSIEVIFPSLLKKWQQKVAANAAVNAGFDTEVLFLAKKKNLKIAEVPVEWHYIGSQRVGIGAAIEALRDIITIRLNDLVGHYN